MRRSRLSPFRRDVAAALALLAVAGGGLACGRKRDAAMPPASGAGAPAAPTLPTLDNKPVALPGSGDKEADSKTGAVTPGEGKTTGTTYPRAEAQVGPNMGGVLSKILVKEGDVVKKGQVLFRQDARDGALRVNQARAALDAAKVGLRAAQTEYDRSKPMLEQNAINRAQWDQLEARYDGARVGVQQAQVALDIAQKMLADATVRSPIDGVVTSKLKNEGEMATMMPPTVVLIVQDQSSLELRFRLPERALAEIKIGARLKARFPSLDIVRDATVVRIQAQVDARTRTVELVADLPNRDQLLRPGLLAEVEIAP